MRMNALESITTKAKALASRALNGQQVEPSEWSTLAAEELRQRAMSEAQADKLRESRMQSLRQRANELNQALSTTQTQIIALSNEAGRIEDRARQREQDNIN